MMSCKRFNKLVALWDWDTRLYSSIDQVRSHPTFLLLVNEGPRIIPLILKRLTHKRERSVHLCLALLYVLTDERPRLDRAGDIEHVVAKWLEWGRTRRMLTEEP